MYDVVMANFITDFKFPFDRINLSFGSKFFLFELFDGEELLRLLFDILATVDFTKRSFTQKAAQIDLVVAYAFGLVFSH